MRLIFFSDIHGVPETVERLFSHADRLQVERLVLLGDALCPGWRSGGAVCDPRRTAELLNSRKREIVAVRGNCDSEADREMLDFSMAEHAEIVAGERRFFLTHGHVWNIFNPPPVSDGTVLAHGHTHIPAITSAHGIVVFNPGSVSLPKGDFPGSFGFFDGVRLSVRRIDDGEVILGEK